MMQETLDYKKTDKRSKSYGFMGGHRVPEIPITKFQQFEELLKIDLQLERSFLESNNRAENKTKETKKKELTHFLLSVEQFLLTFQETFDVNDFLTSLSDLATNQYYYQVLALSPLTLILKPSEVERLQTLSKTLKAQINPPPPPSSSSSSLTNNSSSRQVGHQSSNYEYEKKHKTNKKKEKSKDKKEKDKEKEKEREREREREKERTLPSSSSMSSSTMIKRFPNKMHSENFLTKLKETTSDSSSSSSALPVIIPKKRIVIHVDLDDNDTNDDVTSPHLSDLQRTMNILSEYQSSFPSPPSNNNNNIDNNSNNKEGNDDITIIGIEDEEDEAIIHSDSEIGTSSSSSSSSSSISPCPSPTPTRSRRSTMTIPKPQNKILLNHHHHHHHHHHQSSKHTTKHHPPSTSSSSPPRHHHHNRSSSSLLTKDVKSTRGNVKKEEELIQRLTKHLEFWKIFNAANRAIYLSILHKFSSSSLSSSSKFTNPKHTRVKSHYRSPSSSSSSSSPSSVVNDASTSSSAVMGSGGGGGGGGMGVEEICKALEKRLQLLEVDPFSVLVGHVPSPPILRSLSKRSTKFDLRPGQLLVAILPLNNHNHHHHNTSSSSSSRKRQKQKVTSSPHLYPTFTSTSMSSIPPISDLPPSSVVSFSINSDVVSSSPNNTNDNNDVTTSTSPPGMNNDNNNVNNNNDDNNVNNNNNGGGGDHPSATNDDDDDDDYDDVIGGDEDDDEDEDRFVSGEDEISRLISMIDEGENGNEGEGEGGGGDKLSSKRNRLRSSRPTGKTKIVILPEDIKVESHAISDFKSNLSPSSSPPSPSSTSSSSSYVNINDKRKEKRQTVSAASTNQIVLPPSTSSSSSGKPKISRVKSEKMVNNKIFPIDIDITKNITSIGHRAGRLGEAINSKVTDMISLQLADKVITNMADRVTDIMKDRISPFLQKKGKLKNSSNLTFSYRFVRYLSPSLPHHHHHQHNDDTSSSPQSSSSSSSSLGGGEGGIVVSWRRGMQLVESIVTKYYHLPPQIDDEIAAVDNPEHFAPFITHPLDFFLSELKVITEEGCTKYLETQRNDYNLSLHNRVKNYKLKYHDSSSPSSSPFSSSSSLPPSSPPSSSSSQLSGGGGGSGSGSGSGSNNHHDAVLQNRASLLSITPHFSIDPELWNNNNTNSNNTNCSNNISSNNNSSNNISSSTYHHPHHHGGEEDESEAEHASFQIADYREIVKNRDLIMKLVKAIKENAYPYSLKKTLTSSCRKFYKHLHSPSSDFPIFLPTFYADKFLLSTYPSSFLLQSLDLLLEKYNYIYTKLNLKKEEYFNGTMKDLISTWWLNQVKHSMNSFMYSHGYKEDAIPHDYFEEQPINMNDIHENLRLVREMLKPDSPLSADPVIEELKYEIYPKISRFTSALAECLMIETNVESGVDDVEKRLTLWLKYYRNRSSSPQTQSSQLSQSPHIPSAISDNNHLSIHEANLQPHSQLGGDDREGGDNNNNHSSSSGGGDDDDTTTHHHDEDNNNDDSGVNNNNDSGINNNNNDSGVNNNNNDGNTSHDSPETIDHSSSINNNNNEINNNNVGGGNDNIKTNNHSATNDNDDDNERSDHHIHHDNNNNNETINKEDVNIDVNADTNINVDVKRKENEEEEKENERKVGEGEKQRGREEEREREGEGGREEEGEGEIKEHRPMISEERVLQLINGVKDLHYISEMLRLEDKEYAKVAGQFHIVPISGLAQSHLIRSENMNRTILERWGALPPPPPPPPPLSFLSSSPSPRRHIPPSPHHHHRSKSGGGGGGGDSISDHHLSISQSAVSGGGGKGGDDGKKKWMAGTRSIFRFTPSSSSSSSSSDPQSASSSSSPSSSSSSSQRVSPDFDIVISRDRMNNNNINSGDDDNNNNNNNKQISSPSSSSSLPSPSLIKKVRSDPTREIFKHLLSSNNLLEMKNLLLSNQTRNEDTVNITDRRGWTALHCSASSGDLDLCLTLLEEDSINVNARNNDGNTPLHYLVRVLVDKDDKLLSTIKLLLKKGAEVNIQNNFGESPLHCCFNGPPSVAQLLLSHQANPNIASKTKDTPLHYAIKAGNIPLVATMLNFGADKLLKNENGETAISLAASSSSLTSLLDDYHIII